MRVEGVLPELDRLCRGNGDAIKGPLNGYALLVAIALIESTGGINNYPNFEPYWVPEGTVFTIEGRIQKGRHPLSNTLVNGRYNKFGMASGCSFSSWQILYHTAADMGYGGAPWDLWNDHFAIQWVVKLLNRIHETGADTVAKVADAYNSGTHKDRIVPELYIAKIEAAYNKILESD
ncbi:hypothetical protein LCGC14_0659260 [marine sediment metagenome]|uniref:Transglycosylase SLT domain-containing protein n=1 Tax=marine sediment metagenome TaxID=412755 RepID=A0A0F9QU51_9ZZZZ